MPISFSRREQSAVHIPKEWSLHLAPDRLWKFRGRAGAAHPVWKVPEQGWKLTLGLERNLTCENPDAHHAKWHAITLCSKEWDTPHSSPPSQEEQPQTKKPTAWCFRGEGRQLKFHCPEQPEHPAEVHDFVTCGVAGRTPHCFLPGTASLLFTETWTPVWTVCPTPACQDQQVMFRYYQKKTQITILDHEPAVPLHRHFSYHISTQNFNPPSRNEPLNFTTEICTSTQKHLLAPTTPHKRWVVCTSHMCWYTINRDGKQGAIL